MADGRVQESFFTNPSSTEDVNSPGYMNGMKKVVETKADVESHKPRPASHWSLVIDQVHITQDILDHPYKGSGTQQDPFVVEFIPHDRRNPMNWSQTRKWSITMLVAIATLAVAFVSSAYSGGAGGIMKAFNVSQEVAVVGLSLFVVGFALGPVIWGPMSELYGRQILFTLTYFALTAFNAGCALSQNIETLLICRFLAGSFGSSPLTNAGGVIADMFPASERGVAMAIFAAAPFLGPVIGPIVGGFVGQFEGWRWIEWVMTIFTGFLWLLGTLLIPETYSPVILRKRADKLSEITGQVYKSKMEINQGAKSAGKIFKESLSRPWVFLFTEPIVFILSLYMAIIYGTLYMMFGAFPVVYRIERHWSLGISGLAFCGVAVGMMVAVVYSIYDNKRYNKTAEEFNGRAPPEARLPPSIIGSIALPVGLFWFAWTNSPSIHWLVSVAATVPFGFGMVLVFLSILNYLIDSYVLYAASVLAANTVIRSLFGAAFPLFTTQMYAKLGIHWASTVPAFLALACVPFPYLFYVYGEPIRMKCKWAARAAKELEDLRSAEDGEDGGNDLEILKEGKKGGPGWETDAVTTRNPSYDIPRVPPTQLLRDEAYGRRMSAEPTRRPSSATQIPKMTGQRHNIPAPARNWPLPPSPQQRSLPRAVHSSSPQKSSPIPLPSMPPMPRASSELSRVPHDLPRVSMDVTRIRTEVIEIEEELLAAQKAAESLQRVAELMRQRSSKRRKLARLEDLEAELQSLPPEEGRLS